MENMEANQVINGTFGSIWFNNEKLSEVKSFETKLTFEYEDLKINGKLGNQKKLIGWTGEGTVVVHKVDSFVLKLIKEFFETGKIPDIKIISKLEDPQSKGAERVAIKGITLNEVMLSKFENGTVTETEIPFAFGEDPEFIDLI